MRWIHKHGEPHSIQQFREANEPLGVNLDYRSGFTRKQELRAELMQEQCFLCGYTGTPLDAARLGGYDQDAPGGPVFAPHNEHIKSQKLCRVELGAKVGTVLGEDMDYRNIIAALEVKNSPNTNQDERFGAVVRQLDIIPLPPTLPECETEYAYFPVGTIRGNSERARDTIADLQLNHRTLKDWRLNTVRRFLPLRHETPVPELQQIIHAMQTPMDGKLPEFAFVILQLARDYLAMHQAAGA